MSSHREAPRIMLDPAADNTDTYAFVTPNETVAIITNYIPAENPAGGPNFYEFDDTVTYQINIDNNGDGRPDVTYEFRFETINTNPNTFLYNTGQIDRIDSPNFNRKQTFDVHEVRGRRRRQLGHDLLSPPCNVGLRSTPNYPALANAAIYDVGDGIKVFAGQRLDGFYVDLGSIFDLAALRPFQNLHLIPTPAAPGINALRAFNVHTIAIQIPISRLTSDGSQPTDPLATNATIGVYGAAYRRKATLRDDGKTTGVGPFVQVSRLGNPLFNEVIVPIPRKDEWNGVPPDQDKNFVQYVKQPELGTLLPLLYPGVFPNLAARNGDASKSRDDLVAILLTGIPAGIVPGFQNFTGPTLADQLRLNVAIPPSAHPNVNGILGGDLAGFPNGRRVFDDVVTVELRAVAGLTIPLVDPTFTPDGAAGLINDGTQVLGDVSYLDVFPYLDHPVSGYDVLPLSVAGS
jgi:Domain of unknown function (DUF4331)